MSATMVDRPLPTCWQDVLAALQPAAAIQDGLSHPDDDVSRLQACLHALMLVGQGYALNRAASAREPRWVPNFHWPNASLGNCPDTTYFYTPIEAGGTYRIWGQRNTIHMVDFQIGEAFYGTEKGGSNKALASYDLRDQPVSSDGQFEVVLSSIRPQGYSGAWWPMPPTAETITVRQVAYDWLSEEEALLHIERLDPVDNQAPSAPDLAATVRAITTYASLMTTFPFGAKLHSSLRARGLVNGGVEMMTFGEAGGLADQYYYVGVFDLAENQALMIDTPVPATCRYWNIQLSDEFNGSLDYIFRQSSLNGHQAAVDDDDHFRAVIAHTDPGIANWLDTGGIRTGLFMGRWKEASAKPALPTVTLMTLDDVLTNLPPATQRISPGQRRSVVESRRRAMLARLRY